MDAPEALEKSQYLLSMTSHQEVAKEILQKEDVATAVRVLFQALCNDPAQHEAMVRLSNETAKLIGLEGEDLPSDIDVLSDLASKVILRVRMAAKIVFRDPNRPGIRRRERNTEPQQKLEQLIRLLKDGDLAIYTNRRFEVLDERPIYVGCNPLDESQVGTTHAFELAGAQPALQTLFQAGGVDFDSPDELSAIISFLEDLNFSPEVLERVVQEALQFARSTDARRLDIRQSSLIFTLADALHQAGKIEVDPNSWLTE